MESPTKTIVRNGDPLVNKYCCHFIKTIWNLIHKH